MKLTLNGLRALPEALGDYLFKHRGTVRDAWGLKIFFALPLDDQFDVLIRIRELEYQAKGVYFYEAE